MLREFISLGKYRFSLCYALHLLSHMPGTTHAVLIGLLLNLWHTRFQEKTRIHPPCMVLSTQDSPPERTSGMSLAARYWHRVGNEQPSTRITVGVWTSFYYLIYLNLVLLSMAGTGRIKRPDWSSRSIYSAECVAGCGHWDYIDGVIVLAIGSLFLKCLMEVMLLLTCHFEIIWAQFAVTNNAV